MTQGYGLFVVWIAVLCVACGTVESFVCNSPNRCHDVVVALKGANGDDEGRWSQGQRASETTEAFMERTSRDGAEKIASMSIEERTKRAMLCEAIEDQIFALNDELETLLEPNGLALPENKEKVVELMRDIKTSEERYEALVTGKASPMLGALNAIEDALDDDTEE